MEEGPENYNKDKVTGRHTHTCVHVELQRQGQTGCDLGLLKREKQEMRRREEV